VCVPAALIAGLLLWRAPARVTGGCSPGQLTIEGYTAFAPTAREEAEYYMDQCAGAQVTVHSGGSPSGVAALLQSGPQGAASAIAMSDGPAPPDFTGTALHGAPVAVIPFEMVVNPNVPVRNLTVADIRNIWAGRITNWDQVAGLDLPIRIISWNPGSGTRATFEDKVLGASESPMSSTDCLHKDRDPSSPATRCELPTTQDILTTVGRIPGAISYAEFGQAERYPTEATPVTLNGLSPNIHAMQLSRGYPFWAIEYLYTYGNPSYQAPASGFLRYMSTPTAKDALRTAGFTPCYDQGQSLPDICRARLPRRSPQNSQSEGRACHVLTEPSRPCMCRHKNRARRECRSRA
jgi:ABC-type phosphate transport system substrate-binding protein